MKSKYNVFHAIVAAVVLLGMVSNNFWHNFIHGGFPTPPRVPQLLTALVGQVVLMGALLLALWASTLFIRRPAAGIPPPSDPSYGRKGPAVKTALKWFIPIALAAFALEGLSILMLEHLFHLPAQQQELVSWLKPETYPLYVRLLLFLIVLFEAPVFEELLFRGIVFRGLLSIVPLQAALLATGVLFAVIHVNAAAFLPLVFLGGAFAWLYWRTGSLLAPVAAHFLFNALNLVLALAGITD